jgi:hypothetical protein
MKSRVNKVNIIIILSIILPIMLLIVFVVVLFLYKIKEPFNTNQEKWVVLLTVTVTPKSATQDESESRKRNYITQINRWINETKLPIFVIENSGYTFDEIPKSDRFHVISFNLEKSISSSSEGEKLSIEYALKEMQQYQEFQKCSYILKVTSRYYLNGIENTLNSLTNEQDLYLQIHRIKDFQNSEYYGIKKELMSNFINTVSNQLMEKALYDYSLTHPFETIGPFENKIPRGGDGIVIDPI